MLPSEITIEVRSLDLSRTHQILPQFWTDITAISRLRRVGEWSLSLPRELKAAQALAAPGAGLVITGPEGVLISGPMETVATKQSSQDPTGTLAFTGVDDNCLLGDPATYADPAHAANAQTTAYDIRSGAAESVIRAYVNANIGPAAPSARRAALAQKLTLEADAARGATVTGNARFDTLGELAETLGKLGGVGYRIVQDGGNLVLQFWEPTDKSKEIRLDIANGRLSATEYGLAVPSVTRALVMGQGQGAERTIIERTSTDALAAEVAWGRRREVVKDQRDTDVQAELEQAGDEILLDGGKTRTAMKITPSDDQTMRYQRDWGLGDIVAVVVGTLEVPEVVTSVGMGISKSGVVIGARVGES